MDVIDSLTIQHEEFTIRISVEPDTESTPFDVDCYSAENIRAWKNDEWGYVGFVYTAIRDGIELAEDSIWGTEWNFPGTESSIEAWVAEDFYHPDLVRTVTDSAREAVGDEKLLDALGRSS